LFAACVAAGIVLVLGIAAAGAALVFAVPAKTTQQQAAVEPEIIPAPARVPEEPQRPAPKPAVVAEVAKPSPPAPVVAAPTLAQEEFEKLHPLIKPQRGEWKFADIPWAKSVAEARERAAAEGKPILTWYMAGEPLGEC
jgi:hypothetical protein